MKWAVGGALWGARRFIKEDLKFLVDLVHYFCWWAVFIVNSL